MSSLQNKARKKKSILRGAAVGASLALAVTAAGVGLGPPAPAAAESRCYYKIGDQERVTALPPRIASGTRVFASCTLNTQPGERWIVSSELIGPPTWRAGDGRGPIVGEDISIEGSESGGLAFELEGLAPHGLEVREISLTNGASVIEEAAIARPFRLLSFSSNGTIPISPVEAISVPGETLAAEKRLVELRQLAYSLPSSQQHVVNPMLDLIDTNIKKGLPWHAIEIGTGAEPAIQGLADVARQADAPRRWATIAGLVILALGVVATIVLGGSAAWRKWGGRRRGIRRAVRWQA